MLQRGTLAMTLFVLAAVLYFARAIYGFTQGRHVAWPDIVAGIVLVAAGVYFKTVKRLT